MIMIVPMMRWARRTLFVSPQAKALQLCEESTLISAEWHVNNAIAHFPQGWALPLTWRLLAIKSLSPVLSQHIILPPKGVSSSLISGLAALTRNALHSVVDAVVESDPCTWEEPSLQEAISAHYLSKASCIESILLSGVFLSVGCQTHPLKHCLAITHLQTGGGRRDI